MDIEQINNESKYKLWFNLQKKSMELDSILLNLYCLPDNNNYEKALILILKRLNENLIKGYIQNVCLDNKKEIVFIEDRIDFQEQFIFNYEKYDNEL